MNFRELRKTIIICGGLGTALYYVMTGQKDLGSEICFATLGIWFWFL
jgi:hypothetical protein